MARIKSMGTATMKFNEGLISSGSAANPDGTNSEYAFIVSGSQYLDASDGNHGLTIFKDESDQAFIRFINSNDPTSWYAYIAFDQAENFYIAPGRTQDFYLRMAQSSGVNTYPFRIYDNGKAKFDHGEEGGSATTDLPADVVFSVSGSMDGNNNIVLGGDVIISGSIKAEGSTELRNLKAGIRDVGSSTTVLQTDYVLRCIQNSAITISLPPKATSEGMILIFKDALGTAASNNITIDPDSAETIDGSSSYIINTNKSSVTLICDGINGWMIIG